jgi:4'-phosphopantetheinyl transferase
MTAAFQEELTLSEDEVHVWGLSLVSLPLSMARLQEVLNDHECHRASRFRFEKDRIQFIACRGLLRHILALYVATDPGQLHLSSNAFGKPQLGTGCEGDEDLRFNYSHSDGYAVFAFAKGREVGVDVELIEPQIAKESIPEHFFTKSEVVALRALPLELQGDAFFKCWTRKEAYIKARGEGFRIPLNSFEVTSDRVGSDRDNSDWFLQSFVPAAGYIAALVTKGQRCSTRFIQSPERPFSPQQEGVPCCTS